MKTRFKQFIIIFLYAFTVISLRTQGDGKHKNRNNELKIKL